MWLSIPQSRTVLRLPGSRFSMEQKTSLPKQENACLSIARTSGSREAISDTVSPNPFAYCVLISVGIFKIPAKRISSCEFLSNCSFCTIGGRSFSWISTTMSAHWLASRERRATSLYSLVIGLTLPRTVANNRPFFSDAPASGRCTATLSFGGPGHGFGFFKDAHSHVAPPPYPCTAVGASDQAVIGRMIWDDESIAAALGASEGGVRHGACRPFWLAIANRPAWVARLCAGKDGSQARCAEAVRSLAFAGPMAGPCTNWAEYHIA